MHAFAKYGFSDKAVYWCFLSNVVNQSETKEQPYLVFIDLQIYFAELQLK